jgi:MoxR-like ATPase
VSEPRSPWTPKFVADAIDQWLNESKHAALLAKHGERVLPLLLSGETRCGKTSSLCSAAARLGLPVYHLSLAEMVGSMMGETSGRIRSAFAEIRDAPRALWLVDEIDGVAMRRTGEQGAAQERSLSVTTLLTEIEALPPDVALAATSNVDPMIDPAILSRFTLVRFPPWGALTEVERASFVLSHGGVTTKAGSYAEAVQSARAARVRALVRAVAVVAGQRRAVAGDLEPAGLRRRVHGFRCTGVSVAAGKAVDLAAAARRQLQNAVRAVPPDVAGLGGAGRR